MRELNYLRDRLKEAKSQRSEYLDSGGAKDYASYQRVVGEISGLSSAINEITDLLKNIEKANDD